MRPYPLSKLILQGDLVPVKGRPGYKVISGDPHTRLRMLGQIARKLALAFGSALKAVSK